MSSVEEFSFPFCITTHSFNKDRTNWAPNSNRIVSCSQDKNAYVWTLNQSTNKWKPTLVHLRLDRAATQVRWSPNEEKFAVASSSRSVAVCYFGEDNDWWVSKHIKKPISSTVLSINWHPNNVLLACGGTDMKARVFSGFIKGVDSKPAPSVWGERLPFGTICGEFESEYYGWIHSVSFSPDGNQLAFVAHDSTLTIVDPQNNSITSIKTSQLPYKSLLWIDTGRIVVSGHDGSPAVYIQSANGWELSTETQKKSSSLRNQSPNRSSPISKSSAFNMFKNMDSRMAPSINNEDIPSSASKTEVQGTISELRHSYGDQSSTFSSSSLDGKIVLWNLAVY
ncbi:hypothetical protein BB559_000782 [Furculomyces boomerangus]|uniref:Arp2/3 complex 41 kDa subunit n=1 Tax=Furculomyces boomerangus TaxID=61424 RepID=A0A2T9Z445_9FUNG|nr:hypothetical protein BB559_000782 [Furculomyces boomerangus]